MTMQEIVDRVVASRCKFSAAIGTIATLPLAWSSLAHATTAPVRFTTDFPLNSSIGPLRAGQLCLPKGSVRGTDLISDDHQFDLLVRQVLDERANGSQYLLGDGRAPKVEVHLRSAAVKLCAKSWGMFGMGDTKSLSGKAAFTFTWKMDGQTALAVETIALELNGKDRLTAPAILRRAVTALLGRIADSRQSLQKTK